MNVILVLSLLFFAGGVMLCLTKKNILLILIGIELILNGANLNFIHFSSLQNRLADGQTAVLLTSVTAAAQAAVALAIVLNLFRKYRTVMTDDLTDLKG